MILLLGGSGLLGSALSQTLQSEGYDFLAPSSRELDITDHDQVLAYLNQQALHLIINAAGYTSVDQAEKDEANCYALNAEALRPLIKPGLPLINFSTDYVFHPESRLELSEDTKRNPQSVYAQSQAEGEKYLEASKLNHWYNLRTAWLFGPGGKNFISTILAATKSRPKLQVVADQIGRPTYAPDLATWVVEYFVRPLLANNTPLPNGHYHAQNTGSAVSWADLARFALKQAGSQTVVEDISTTHCNSPAPRPRYSLLKNTRLPHSLRNWETAVQEFINKTLYLQICPHLPLP